MWEQVLQVLFLLGTAFLQCPSRFLLPDAYYDNLLTDGQISFLPHDKMSKYDGTTDHLWCGHPCECILKEFARYTL